MSTALATLHLEPIRDKMGRVTTSVRLVNHQDQILASKGLIESEQVRQVQVDDVLVDTGAYQLALPADIVQLLGLPFKHNIRVNTAGGKRDARVMYDVEINACGRSAVFECVELPVGTPVLLGVLPLEALGLQPDLRAEELRVLPEDEFMFLYRMEEE